MKSRKTPQQKKVQSYARDRRDIGSNNNKSLRNWIPRRKARINREYRRTTRQKLILPDTQVCEETADTIDFTVKAVQRKKFSKPCGMLLREVVKAKLKRRSVLNNLR